MVYNIRKGKKYMTAVILVSAFTFSFISGYYFSFGFGCRAKKVVRETAC